MATSPVDLKYIRQEQVMSIYKKLLLSAAIQIIFRNDSLSMPLYPSCNSYSPKTFITKWYWDFF